MELHNLIADISLKKFLSLPKTGKPNAQEWTILSTIVLYDTISKNMEVLSLGTGSKCIGKSFMSPNGDILNDSHAEVICRRAFIKYIYFELNNFFKTNNSDIFFKNDDLKILIKPNLSFHMFSSHMPCGDASIFSKNENDNFGTILKFELEEQSGPSESKRVKLDTDIHRTGAKCLEGDLLQDPKKSGAEFHVVGAVRTKPGRGDPTLSVSCSDKLAKWMILGIQGSLLFKILQKPIYLSSITIAKNTPFSHDAFKRAISDRILNKKTNFDIPFKHIFPEIQQSNLDFEFFKDSNKQPSPSSIIWFKGCKKVEVAVEGRKQGVTKKNKNTKAGRLSICKIELFQDFCDLLKNHIFENAFKEEKNYFEWKNDENCPYTRTWKQIKNDVFEIWPSKDKNLLMFNFE